MAEGKTLRLDDEAQVSRDGATIVTNFWYPRNEGHVTHIQVGIYDVRAADDIRIHYDFDRDGYAIEQASTFEWEEGDTKMDMDWQEVAYVQAWGRAGGQGRPIQTDLWKLLDLLLLTEEERGMHGAMVREWVFERAGRTISKEEIAQYVDHALDVQLQAALKRDGLSMEQWEAKWEADNPGRAWKDAVQDDDDGERAFLLGQVTGLVDLMAEEHRSKQELRRRTENRNTP